MLAATAASAAPRRSRRSPPTPPRRRRTPSSAGAPARPAGSRRRPGRAELRPAAPPGVAPAHEQGLDVRLHHSGERGRPHPVRPRRERQLALGRPRRARVAGDDCSADRVDQEERHPDRHLQLVPLRVGQHEIRYRTGTGPALSDTVSPGSLNSTPHAVHAHSSRRSAGSTRCGCSAATGVAHSSHRSCGGACGPSGSRRKRRRDRVTGRLRRWPHADLQQRRLGRAPGRTRPPRCPAPPPPPPPRRRRATVSTPQPPGIRTRTMPSPSTPVSSIPTPWLPQAPPRRVERVPQPRRELHRVQVVQRQQAADQRVRRHPALQVRPARGVRASP